MAYPTSCLFLLLLFLFVAPEVEHAHTHSSQFIRQLNWHKNRIVRRHIHALRPMSFWIMDMFFFEEGKGIEIIHDLVNEIGDLIVGYGAD